MSHFPICERRNRRRNRTSHICAKISIRDDQNFDKTFGSKL